MTLSAVFPRMASRPRPGPQDIERFSDPYVRFALNSCSMVEAQMTYCHQPHSGAVGPAWGKTLNKPSVLHDSGLKSACTV
jgi:hypothetical protein